MSWLAFVLAAAAAALLLALKLRGPGRPRDLLGPPRPKRRRIDAAAAARLTELFGRGEPGEALRLMRDWGYSEEDGLKMVRFVEGIDGVGGEDEAGEGAAG